MKNVLLAVLVLAVGFLVWKHFDTKTKLSEFPKREQRLKQSLDSVVQLQREADLFAIQMATKYNVAKVQLAEQSKATEKFKNRYDALRNLSVPRLSDSQIDSAVSRLYPIR